MAGSAAHRDHGRMMTATRPFRTRCGGEPSEATRRSTVSPGVSTYTLFHHILASLPFASHLSRSSPWTLAGWNPEKRSACVEWTDAGVNVLGVRGAAGRDRGSSDLSEFTSMFSFKSLFHSLHVKSKLRCVAGAPSPNETRLAAHRRVHGEEYGASLRPWPAPSTSERTKKLRKRWEMGAKYKGQCTR